MSYITSKKSSIYQPSKQISEQARQFSCLSCHQLVHICRTCDRGNVYCGSGCSKPARKKSQQAAAKRYRTTLKGKLAAAKRQQKFRVIHSKIKKVTHQGSLPSAQDDVLSSHSSTAPEKTEPSKAAEPIWCDFCGCACAQFVRLGFVGRDKRSATLNAAQGP